MLSDARLTRTDLSREVCAWLGWQDARGRPKDMSCRVALLKLCRRGLIELPAGKEVSFGKPGQTVESLPRTWLSIEKDLAQLGRVWLVPIDSEQALSKTWWAMMQRTIRWVQGLCAERSCAIWWPAKRGMWAP